jgi:hypothetical protein
MAIKTKDNKEMTLAPGEQLIATMGQKYSTSFFTGAGFSKTALVLTNKALSGVGKTYSTKKGVISFKAPLRNISSVGVEYSSEILALILGILTLPIFIGVLFLIYYFVRKERYIVINVQGVLYALSLRGIPNEHVNLFIEKILLAASIPQF